MDHIVTFSVSVDDANIVKHIEENAERNITEEIKQAVLLKLFSHSYYATKIDDVNSADLSGFAQNIFEEIIKEFKDDIIEKASNKLVAKMYKGKKVQEAIKDVLDSADLK